MAHMEENFRDWRWFHNNITRQGAEDILISNPDGSYLLRESMTNTGQYTLSVYYQLEMTHYIIYINNNKLSLNNTLYFNDLQSLFEYYSKVVHENFRLIQPVCDYNSLKPNLVKLGYTIKPDEIQLKEIMDKGEFSEVYEGCYKRRTVAVKKMVNKDFTKDVLQEANIMAMLKHPNLLQLIGVVFDNDVYLVLEHMDEGNLIAYLRSRGRECITEDWQLNLSLDICAGMDYLERKNLVHCDLAARNILLSKNSKVKISDFGLSKNNGTKDARNKFPARWTAPEAIINRVFTNKCDVWSYGVLLWEIFSFGKIPYPGVPATQISNYIQEGNRMTIPVECPIYLQSIIQMIWNINPSERPSFKKILELMVPLFGSRV